MNELCCFKGSIAEWCSFAYPLGLSKENIKSCSTEIAGNEVIVTITYCKK